MKTQEQDSKKAYEAPQAKPVVLDDETLDAAAGGGGTGGTGEYQYHHKTFNVARTFSCGGRTANGQ